MKNENGRGLRISPTMLGTWERGLNDWVRTYIGVPMEVMKESGETVMEVVKLRDPQNEAMAAGSAFDAFVKGHLSVSDGGDGDGVALADVAIRREKAMVTLMERQVDVGLRPFGYRVGKYLMDEYQRLGALGLLIKEMGAHNDLQLFMEERLDGIITDIPITGRPDLYWYRDNGILAIRDWKVSQLKKDKPAITKGYQALLGPTSVLPSRNVRLLESIPLAGVSGVAHKEAGINLEEILPREATQLCFYAWLAGSGKRGADGFIPEPIDGGIDRLVGMPLRVVIYRGLIGVDFQLELIERIKACWAGIQDFLSGPMGDPLALVRNAHGDGTITADTLMLLMGEASPFRG